MRVEVTEEDIRAGKRCNAYACPLARAIGRAAGKPYAVGITDTWELGVEAPAMVDLPPEAQEWRDRFDQEIPVQPFAFELEEAE